MTFSIRFAVVATAALAFAASSAHAQIEIFGDDENGNFDTLNPSNDNDTDPSLRRADPNFDGFVANLNFDVSGGFGGIDQAAGNGNPGLLANTGVTTVAVAFPDSGSFDFGPDGLPGGGDDVEVLPSGMFSFPDTVVSPGGTLLPGATFEVSFDAFDNTAGATFDFTIGLLFDGATDIATDLVPIFSDTITGVVAGPDNPAVGNSAQGLVTIDSALGVATTGGTNFNVAFILDNTTDENDQVQVDNVSIILRDDILPQVIGDVNGDLMVDIEDFNDIRDNFFNTGADDGSLAGEAVGAVDGVVDIQDFIVFRNAFEATGASVAGLSLFSGAVPEPGSAMILLCGVGLGCVSRTRRR